MRIAYIDAQAYAGGVANSVRVAGMVEALELGGHQVSLYREASGDGQSRTDRRALRRAARILPYAAVLGSGVTPWLAALRELPDVVVCYGPDPRYLARVQAWSRRHRVPLIVDIVDWYAASDVAGLGPKVFALVNDLWVMRTLLRRCDGAIVASRLLERHCAAMGLTTLRVPAVLGGVDVPRPAHKRGFTISYAGAPGLREAQALENLRRLARDGVLERQEIELRVIGASADAELDADVERGINYLGRVPRDVALRHIVESRFTVVQRPPLRRFAQAGFPSKVAESLLLGVPVIANLSSDLDQYLVDRTNSIVLAGDDYDALRDGIERAVDWSPSVDSVKIADSAAGQFSPAAVADVLTEFLEASLNGQA